MSLNAFFRDTRGHKAQSRSRGEGCSLRAGWSTPFAVYTNDAKDIPKLKDYIKEFGECYEYDIPFWKRYMIDKMISPMAGVSVKARKTELGLEIDEIKALGKRQRRRPQPHVL